MFYGMVLWLQVAQYNRRPCGDTEHYVYPGKCGLSLTSLFIVFYRLRQGQPMWRQWIYRQTVFRVPVHEWNKVGDKGQKQ